MIGLYSIIYSILGLLLLIYGLVNKKSRPHLFSYALGLNIFPLIFVPYLGMDAARIGGVPIAYVPMVTAGIVLFITNGFKIHRKDRILSLLILLFLIYTLTIAVIKGMSLLTFTYWLMWVFNFFLLLVTINVFSKYTREKSSAIIKKIFIIFFLGSAIGIFRFIIGIENNSNFMPMFNRNGTVVMVVMLTPLAFYLLDNKKISNTFFWVSYITIFLCLVLLQSRSGFLGFILLSFLYLLLSGKVKFIKILAISLLTITFLASPFGEKLNNRLSHAVTSISVISSGNTITSGESDYKRNMLILSAIEIIKNNFWFGSGIGLENYQKAFHEYVGFFHHNAKAHNFYLSYLAELGIFGFVLLIIILFIIYKKLSRNKKNIAFRISFFGMAFMMIMNEYIGLPELWFFFGILIGVSVNEKKEVCCDRVR